MKWKIKVDLTDPVPVPARLRTKLIRHLRGAKALDVRVESSRNKYLQCNKLDFAQKSASTMPDETLDDLCDALSMAMHAKWIDKNEDAETVEPVRFRIEAILHADATRSQSGFNFTWDPEAEDDLSEDVEDGMRQDAFSHSQLMLDRQLAYTEELHAVILKLANMNAEPIAASSNLAQWGGQMAMEGMKSQLMSHKMNFDREDARAKHQEETLRSERTWERVGTLLEFGVKAVGERIGQYMAEKRGGAEVVRTAASAVGVDLESRPAEDADEADAEEDADLRDRPIATLCGLFGSGLSNEQRKTLRKIAGRQYPLFDDLFCVETDEDAVNTWETLANKLSLKQLMELNVLLNPEQREEYKAVATMVGRFRAAAESAASDDGDEPEPDDE